MRDHVSIQPIANRLASSVKYVRSSAGHPVPLRLALDGGVELGVGIDVDEEGVMTVGAATQSVVGYLNQTPDTMR